MNNLDKEEKKLIQLIKIVPILMIIVFSIIITYVILSENIQQHQENLRNIKENFITNQKSIIKNEVLRVVRQINYQKSKAEDDLKKLLKEKTIVAHNVAMNIYKQNIGKSKPEIKKMIKDAIREIRFNNGRGYFFIYTNDGDNVLLPPLPEVEGTNLWNLKDKKGLYTIRELSKISTKDKEGFLNWYWYKPNDNTQMYKKIGFVKQLEPLNWFIGTGEYLKDFEDTIKKDLINEIQKIRYGKNGYIFMHQFDGLCLVHVKEKNIGQYRLKVQDKNGKFIIKDIIDVAKKGEGFIEYIGTVMPTTGLPAKKISYISSIKQWKWQIGAGTYSSVLDNKLIKIEEDFQNKIKLTIIKIIAISTTLTIILIWTLLIFSKDINKRFYNYKQSIKKKNLENKKQEEFLNEQSKMASMGEMIGNIAHQWRQPLSVISTASTGMLLQKEYGTLTDEQFMKTCGVINTNAQYLSKTIDDFRNFVKGDSKKTIFSLTHNIDSFLHLVEGTTKSNDINIVLDLDNDIQINGFENELPQCLINIFNNAKDAFNDIETKYIFISTSIEENNAVIKIKDNAGGIEEDILGKIFEPYFTTKHKSQGTGLGLHMTYNLIIDGMDGTIEANNITYKYEEKEYIGAEFTITLPLS